MYIMVNLFTLANSTRAEALSYARALYPAGRYEVVAAMFLRSHNSQRLVIPGWSVPRAWFRILLEESAVTDQHSPAATSQGMSLDIVMVRTN